MPFMVRPGDVVLYRSESRISRAIRYFDQSEVNHAALAIEPAQVLEIHACGLEQRALLASTEPGGFAVVRRLVAPVAIDPVLTRALVFRERANRYAYEQILLLALLALTRRVPVNRFLNFMLRRILDAAAATVCSFAERVVGMEALTCAEFVYRCYDEAAPGIDDPYTLRVNPEFGQVARRRADMIAGLGGVGTSSFVSAAAAGGAGMPPDLDTMLREALTRGAPSGGGLGGPPVTASGSSPGFPGLPQSLAAVLARGVRKGSLLDRVQRDPARRDGIELENVALGGLQRPPPRTPGQVEAAIDEAFDDYEAKVAETGGRDEPGPVEQTVSDADVDLAVASFAHQHMKLATPPRAETRAALTVARMTADLTDSLPPGLRHLFTTAADFVTPGDLYKVSQLTVPERLGAAR